MIDDVHRAEDEHGDADDARSAPPAARTYEAARPPVVDEPLEAVAAAAAPEADLDRVERDLEGVEVALRRLDDGSYWTDEITGEPLDEALLAADPVARRNVA